MMPPLRIAYLALAIWGAVHPMIYYARWMRENEGGFGGLIGAWHANFATAGIVLDLLIAAIALTLWIVVETWVRKNWIALLAIPATFLVGVSCGLPLFLFLRTRPIV
jgi:hypothetical protein